MATRVDWRALAALGLGRLRLAPAVFWAMTPYELDCAAQGAFGAAQAPLGRSDLNQLMALHPDCKKENVCGDG
ncbi:MAG: phage tail assembly chaperone [Rubrimonas sp.]|uniref:phage tail assembly chaperone n=1 Tax=Rubrimonas sp. TaxID=2036015 RepID=UPI002FDD615D